MSHIQLETIQEKLLKSHKEKTVGKKVDLAPRFGEAIEAVYGKDARQVLNGPMKEINAKLKDLGVTDITSLRLLSVSDRSPVLRNEDSKFLNFLESQGKSPMLKDYQYRIRERNINTASATPFNPDGDLPAIRQSKRPARTNTLTFLGNTTKVSFMADAIASGQANVNLMSEEIDDEIVRIRTTMSSMLLSNTEQVVEAIGSVPQLGGMIDRSILNNFAVTGGNLTEAYIQQGADAIRAALGSGKQQVLWIPSSQLAVLDNLMITRYPGNDAMTHFQRQDLAKRMVGFNVEPDLMYLPRPGKPIPVVFDDQLPDGTALMFTWERELYPRLPKFQLFGSLGPWVLARPNASLYELVVVWDSFSLDDPLVESRAVYTSLN